MRRRTDFLVADSVERMAEREHTTKPRISILPSPVSAPQGASPAEPHAIIKLRTADAPTDTTRQHIDANKRTLQEWAAEITTLNSRGTARTLELACLLLRVRKSLARGQWEHLWSHESVPFRKRKANMLVAIGETLHGLNSAHLPGAWNTLYYLARLGRPTVDFLIAQSRIHAAMTLNDAKELLAEFGSSGNRRGQAWSVRRRIERFATFVQDNWQRWSSEDRQLAHSTLLDLTNLTRIPAPNVSAQVEK